MSGVSQVILISAQGLELALVSLQLFQEDPLRPASSLPLLLFLILLLSATLLWTLSPSTFILSSVSPSHFYSNIKHSQC